MVAGSVVSLVAMFVVSVALWDLANNIRTAVTTESHRQ